MYHLVYISSTQSTLTKVQLRSLLMRSRVKNAELGITGILLHQAGKILQVLEGEERSVRTLYDKIQGDPRHIRCTTLLEEEILLRHYPQWAMAFRNLDTTPMPFNDPDMVGLPIDLSEAQRMLLHFHFNNARSHHEQFALVS